MIRLIAALCALAISGPASAEPLAHISGVDDAELRAAIVRAVGDVDNELGTPLQRARSAAGRARRVLRANGYFGATLDPGVNGDGEAVVRVTTGPRFVLTDIQFDTLGDDAAAQIVRQTMSIEAGMPYEARRVVGVEATAHEALLEAGWPDAQIGEREILVDHATGTVTLTYRFEPGAFALPGPLTVSSEAWRYGYISALSPLQAGQPVRRSDLETFESRLTDLDSVSSATINLTPSPEDTVEHTLDLQLQPAPRHAIETSLSYSTSNGAGATGAWARNNMFGGDETLILTAQLQTLDQGLGTLLRLPHWRRLNQTLQLSGAVRSEETDAFDQREFSLAGDLVRRGLDGRTYSMGVSADISQVTDDLGQRDTISLEGRLGMAWDRRDDPLNPSSGHRLRTELAPVASLGDVNSSTFVWKPRAAPIGR